MLVDVGERVHVVERRLFENDVRRHFFGEVMDVDIMAMRVSGYLFLYDGGSSSWIRKDERRNRLIPIGAYGYVINIAPRTTDIEAVRYSDEGGRLTVTDGGGFQLDINEFGLSR